MTGQSLWIGRIIPFQEKSKLSRTVAKINYSRWSPKGPLAKELFSLRNEVDLDHKTVLNSWCRRIQSKHEPSHSALTVDGRFYVHHHRLALGTHCFQTLVHTPCVTLQRKNVLFPGSRGWKPKTEESAYKQIHAKTFSWMVVACWWPTHQDFLLDGCDLLVAYTPRLSLRWLWLAGGIHAKTFSRWLRFAGGIHTMTFS